MADTSWNTSLLRLKICQHSIIWIGMPEIKVGLISFTEAAASVAYMVGVEWLVSHKVVVAINE